MKGKPVLIVAGIGVVIVCSVIFWYQMSVGKRVTMVTDKCIFSAVDDAQFEGEGFFVTFQNGKEVFVFSTPGEDPHAIENMRRKLFSAVRTQSPVTYPARVFPQSRDLYLASKYDLDAEHRLLPAAAYHGLAEEVRQRGLHKKVVLVPFNSFHVSQNQMRFFCQDLTGIDGLTMTTGGSVYLITIHFSEGDPLNVGLAANTPNGEQLLIDLSMQIERLAGTDAQIVAENVDFQHEIFTTAGVRSGWVANMANVSLESEGQQVQVGAMIKNGSANGEDMRKDYTQENQGRAIP